MAHTYGDVIQEARRILQDTRESSGFRYETPDLVDKLNNALSEIYRVRPDAFFPDYDIPHVTADDLGAEFPIDRTFFLPTVLFVAGMAELRDEEYASDGRAATIMSQFIAKIRTSEA